jgi:hypothetical protein
MPVLNFDLSGVEVSLHAVRQDGRPRVIFIYYEILADTD